MCSTSACERASEKAVPSAARNGSVAIEVTDRSRHVNRP
jgi:hypothetical protein